MLGKKNRVKKFVGLQKFMGQINFLGKQTFRVTKLFGSKKNLIRKIFGFKKIWGKEKILCVPPFAISIHLLFANSIFPATRTLFLIRERLVFSIKLGSSQVYQIFATNAQDSQSKLDDKQTASVTFETLMNNFLNTLDTLLIH